MRRLVVAISGATGAIYGIRLLEALQMQQDLEAHLVMSAWAERTIAMETEYNPVEVKKMAAHCHDYRDQGAPIASGSFGVD